jgi:D-beta-D-heptose 7-phosphate kinase/D-beta-D-heptose 1-phosphate adenosyltransferase
MKGHLAGFSKTRVLVVGDVMLDRYWSGATGRISPEAPVPVVHVNERIERAGGAANVALNAAALGAGSMILGVIGDDEAGDTLTRLLRDEAGIASHFVRNPAAPTITKLRVLSRHQQLIRLDFEGDSPSHYDAGVAELLGKHLNDADVVVLSDYGKGTLANAQALIRAARAACKPVLVDPKRTDFEAYRGASLITPNMAEFEAVVGRVRDDEELARKGAALIAAHDLEALLVTRSEKGMSLLRRGQEPLHIPAQAREVFDVTGAGDTVIATFAVALAAGLDWDEAARLSNITAGIVVGKLGAATVTPPELRRALQQMSDTHRGVMSEANLLEAVEDARAHGESVVMTNGCFDILHAGHVNYLQQARAHGDRLVVAINDDDSVRRLKGDSRPIVPLRERMAVLAGLGCVDWVVPFSEDTPERLICAVRPDVLVKGGDYRPDQIAGNQCAGEVKVLGFVEGCSTSNIIAEIERRKGDE